MGSLQFRLQLSATLQSIHHRHHHITDNNIRYILHGHFYSRMTVRSLYRYVLISKQRLHITTHIGIVVNHQDTRLAFIRFHLFRFCLRQFFHYRPGRNTNAFRLFSFYLCGRPPVDRDIYCKHRSLSLHAIHGNRSSVQFHKSLCQCQSDARAGMIHINLIEPVKDMPDMLD